MLKMVPVHSSKMLVHISENNINTAPSHKKGHNTTQPFSARKNPHHTAEQRGLEDKKTNTH
jgi:hypothetical protein